MRKPLIYFLFLLTFFPPRNLIAQQTQQDSLGKPIQNVKVSAFPVAFYTPETAFGFGGLGIATFYLRGEPQETRPSSVQLGLSYTTKSQFLVFLPFELYRDDERWRAVGEVGFYKYFYNFFGLGIDSRKEDEETYEVIFPRLRLSVLREVLPNFSIGMGYELDIFTNLKIEDGGILEASDVVGKRDATVSNIGIEAFYDTRDDIFFPTKGFFIQGNFFKSLRFLGSSFGYSKFELDNSFYQKIKGRHVIATNLFLGQTSDDAPFYDLYYLGSKRSRGYDNRRFQDNAELNLALEYRFPIAGRFGGVLFGSTGTVAPDLGRAFSSAYKNAAGLGLRYIFNKRDGVRIRVDYGRTGEGGNFYFTIKEAF